MAKTVISGIMRIFTSVFGTVAFISGFYVVGICLAHLDEIRCGNINIIIKIGFVVFIGSFLITWISIYIDCLIEEIEDVKRKNEAELRIVESKHKNNLCALKKDYEESLSSLQKINTQLSDLLISKSPFRMVASMKADCDTSIYEKDELYLRYKPKPATNSADKIKEIRNIMRENIAEYKQMKYKYEFLLSVFPELKFYVDDEQNLVHLNNYSGIDDFEDNRDRVRDWISNEEYIKMSVDERNQLALDKYKKRIKGNWEIGVEYELYIGYLLREGKSPFDRSFGVIQYGELNGVQDLGRDIVATTVGEHGEYITYIIQCKRWSDNKLIHENVICQIYGTTIAYQMKNEKYANDKLVPVFVSTTNLSDMAKKFAKKLGVLVYTIPMDDYPMIKCNINNGNKIYHLPFDQQYHRTEIKKPGEFYAWTVKEATQQGFRRAMRHFKDATGE